MGIFDGVLLASDFDGTLAVTSVSPDGIAAPDRGAIPQRVYDAVNFFISEGGYFTVCTGRSYQGFPYYDPELINAPVILCNGSLIYDYPTNTVLMNTGLTMGCADALRDIHAHFPNAAMELYGVGKTWCINLNTLSKDHLESQRIHYEIIEDVAQSEAPWPKLMFGSVKEGITQMQEYIREHHPQIGFIPTTGRFLEITVPGSHKGAGLLALANHLGCKPEHAYAIGDGDNDVDMLVTAAKAFVPSNGSDWAKAKADYIVCSNAEGAVADAIEILKTIYRK